MRIRLASLLSASLLAGVVSLSSACSHLPDRIGFAAQTAQLQSGTQVNFQDAYVEDDIFKVKLYIQNLSQQFMLVDRNGFALRLADGRILRRAIGTFTTHHAYNLPPGGGHEVFVDFRDPGRDMRHIQAASLIVGGIAFADDMRQRVVGELPLLPTGAR